MTAKDKEILSIVKECLDDARQKIDIVRFGDATDKEYKMLTEIHSLLCEATDIYYMMNV